DCCDIDNNLAIHGPAGLKLAPSVATVTTMDYNRAALFVRVARAGSFTAAAAAAGLPKSSVSRSIAHLEEELGVRLLQRTTRKLALTDAGQAYFDSVRGAVASIDDADAA